MSVEPRMPVPEYIVIVCTANICRSPMAAALLRHALAAQPEPLRSLQVVSAGVAAREDEPATENSIIALKKVGLDLSSHVSRPLTHELLNGALAVQQFMGQGPADMAGKIEPDFFQRDDGIFRRRLVLAGGHACGNDLERSQRLGLGRKSVTQ